MSPILALLTRLQKANEAYRAGEPIMSDAAYDQLEVELREKVEGKSDPDALLAQHFLASIGGDADTSPFQKVRHTVAMTSLNKVHTPAELEDWQAKTGQKGPFVWSEKLDGLSVDLMYSKGLFTRGTTRGKEGDVGDDITRNVLRMKGIQLTAEFDEQPLQGNIRGEIILTHEDLKEHFPHEDNPRNSAVGKAKALDGKGAEHCTIIVYNVLGGGFSGKSQSLEALENAGFIVPMWGVGVSLPTILNTYQLYCDSLRAKAPYDIDGLVVEFDEFSKMDALGEKNHRPAGAVAFKFPSNAKKTALLNIIWQVGKSGIIAPVSIFEPVVLAGATTQRAFLHNIDNIHRLASDAGSPISTGGTGLYEGMPIMAARNGDVNPQVSEVIAGLSSGPEFMIPTVCPACSTPLVMRGAFLLCTNHEECPEQVTGAIERWVKKIGVIGLGGSFIEAVVEHAGVNDAADLYTLDPSKLEDIRVDGVRLGRKAHLSLEALHKEKNLPLHIFIGSLGIRLCARSTCKTIVEAGFNTLDRMERATVADIEAIPGLGEARAEEFVRGLLAKQALIDKLQQVGVVIEKKATGSLSGQSFCFTGFRDPTLEKQIEAAGGDIKTSVGRGLTFLVTRDDRMVTSAKIDKARGLGCQIVSQNYVRAMLVPSVGS